MTTQEMQAINDLQAQGLGYRKISAITGIPANTVKTYCRRHKEELPPPTETNAFCRGCGKPIYRNSQYRPRLFCSDSCRMQYWNSHRDQVQHKKTYTFSCPYCGKDFQSPGNRDRKYCSRKCADSAKRKGTVENERL